MTRLSRRNDHLALHRRLILSRSLFAGVAGLTPIPLLDDWLVLSVKRGTIRRIAEARGVDLDEPAVRAVAEGVVPRPSWKNLITTTGVTAFMTRSLRRALLVYVIAKRAEDARRAFAVATLFDHYCARLHVGAGLEEPAGKRLRAAIDEAIAAAPSGIAARVFKRAIVGGARALVLAPVKLLTRDEGRAEEVADEAMARAQGGNALSRAIRAVDHELSTAGAGWLDDLVSGFERAWRRHKEASP